MRTEPDIDMHALVAFLRDRYALDVERLEFVPEGIDSWSYLAILDDGGRRFLKLVRQAPPPAAAPGSALPLMAGLADLGRVRVARPIRDRDGGLAQAFDGYELHLLEFLEGHTLADERTWPDPLYASVAEAVASIHGSTDAVRDLVTGVERFELPFLASLADTLDGLGGTGDAIPGDLHDLLAPMAAALRTGLARLEALGDIARSADTNEVLCHTDIWGSNLLLSDDGTLHVLDWGGALIGSPEADLFMFAGTNFFPIDRFAWFLDRYDAVAPPVQLDADVLGFYLYRRNLEDLASFVASLVEGNTEAMDRDATLRITAALLAELPLLEVRIGGVRRVLHDRAWRARVRGRRRPARAT